MTWTSHGPCLGIGLATKVVEETRCDFIGNAAGHSSASASRTESAGELFLSMAYLATGINPNLRSSYECRYLHRSVQSIPIRPMKHIAGYHFNFFILAEGVLNWLSD